MLPIRRMSIVMIVGRMQGRVMCSSFFHLDAPSTVAASYSEGSMLVSAAR